MKSLVWLDRLQKMFTMANTCVNMKNRRTPSIVEQNHHNEKVIYWRAVVLLLQESYVLIMPKLRVRKGYSKFTSLPASENFCWSSSHPYGPSQEQRIVRISSLNIISLGMAVNDWTAIKTSTTKSITKLDFFLSRGVLAIKYVRQNLPVSLFISYFHSSVLPSDSVI